MSVSGVGSSNQSQSSGIASDSSTIAGNFDTFLSLLTTQLKNQDPLDPLDTNQFTQQLVEFSSVEQELKSNDYLSSLVQATQNSANNTAVSYIGKQVTASGVNSDLKNGQAIWTFDLPQAADVTVVIKDQSGNEVYSETGSLNAGTGQFNWDGTKNDGTIAKDGTYSISISAKNANGQYVAADTQTTGTVTGVDISGTEPSLMIGNRSIRLSDITSISTPSSSS